MPIKGIAFDLEGTVIDVERAHHEGHLVTAAEVGVSLTLAGAFQKLPHFIGGPDDKICEEIWVLSDRSQLLEFIVERDKFHYHRLLKELSIEPRPGFLEVLKAFRTHGLKTTIGSLTERTEAAILLERSGLANFFDRSITVLREDVKKLKPYPDVFLETAHRMGINPTQQIVFEDSPHGIRAALMAGSYAIGMPVYDLPKVIKQLKRLGACAIFRDWTEINLEQLLREFV